MSASRHYRTVVGIGILLETLVHVFAGPAALPALDSDRLVWALPIAVGVGLLLLMLNLVESICRMRHFLDGSGNVAVRVLWRSIAVNPLAELALILFSAYAITGSSSLAEYYRIHASAWHDTALWALEEPLFTSLLGSALDVPRFWDPIYFMLWPALLLALAVLIRRQRRKEMATFLTAALLAFYATRIIAIIWPSAGPAFYRPDLFAFDGTASHLTQEALRAYMKGLIPQNGGIPGTEAMPSLHVGLTGMLVWFLWREAPWSTWLTIPWMVLIWMSTLMLGWHYALDGVGGLVVATLAILAARGILSLTALPVTAHLRAPDPATVTSHSDPAPHSPRRLAGQLSWQLGVQPSPDVRAHPPMPPKRIYSKLKT